MGVFRDVKRSKRNSVGNKRQATITLLLFRTRASLRFWCSRLLRCGGRLSRGRSLGLAGLNQLVASELVRRFLLFIVIVIIRNYVVILVLELGRGFLVFSHPLTS